MNMIRHSLAVLLVATSAASLQACLHLPAAPEATSTTPGGAVTVHVQLPRRISAMASDIEHITMQLENINQPRYVYERSLDRAALEAGQGVTFTGLHPIHHYLEVRAYDAENSLIGRASQAFNVTTAAMDHVTVRLQLVPTYAEPPAATGDVAPSFDFTELPEAGAEVATYSSPLEWCSAMAADSAGAVWAAGEDRMIKFGPDGQVLVDKQLGSNMGTIYDMAADSQNNVWVVTVQGLRKFDPEGAPLASVDLAANYALSIDGSDNVWVSAYKGVRKVGPEGTVLATYTRDEFANGQSTRVTVDEVNGLVWFQNAYPTVSSTGAQSTRRVLGRFTLQGDYMGDVAFPNGSGNKEAAVHPDGHVWLFETDAPTHEQFQQLVRIGPDGTTSVRTPGGVFCRNLAFDYQGNVWVARSTEYNNLYELTAEGTPVGGMTIEGGSHRVVNGQDNHLWVHGEFKLTKVSP